MRTIELTANVTPGGTLIVPLPPDITGGEHRVLVVIDEQPIAPSASQPFRFSAYDVELADPMMKLDREELYRDER